MTLNYIISIDPDLWRNRKLFPSLIDLAAPPVLFAANNKEKASGLDTGHGQDKLQVLETYFLIWNQVSMFGLTEGVCKKTVKKYGLLHYAL